MMEPEWVDLRSDTVSHPTPEMWEAMANAEVGDDVYGEDPTVKRLQDMAAERVGKEAALFVPSGTMGNLASILAHCQRGEEAIIGHLGHAYIFEAGGFASLGGVQPRVIPNQADGTLVPEDIVAAIRTEDAHFPKTRLICLENTHNICGGNPITLSYTNQVGEIAREHDLCLHLDGARIFNAAAALGVSAEELAGPADSITFCLSKGLCAPVGSLICGSRDFIYRAHRMRKQLGGGMRQAGVIAAAGVVALTSMTERLHEDHERAARLGEVLRGLAWVEVEGGSPATNMIFMRTTDDAPMDDNRLLEHFRERGIRLGTPRAGRFRLVFHYWIDDIALERVIDAFQSVA
jgi:threonine aldolase